MTLFGRSLWSIYKTLSQGSFSLVLYRCVVSLCCIVVLYCCVVSARNQGGLLRVSQCTAACRCRMIHVLILSRSKWVISPFSTDPFLQVLNVWVVSQFCIWVCMCHFTILHDSQLLELYSPPPDLIWDLSWFYMQVSMSRVSIMSHVLQGRRIEFVCDLVWTSCFVYMTYESLSTCTRFPVRM